MTDKEIAELWWQTELEQLHYNAGLSQEMVEKIHKRFVEIILERKDEGSITSLRLQLEAKGRL